MACLYPSAVLAPHFCRIHFVVSTLKCNGDQVFNHPPHPYTQALVSAIPNMEKKTKRIALPGEPRSPIDPDPRVCRFFGRCPQSGGRCDTEEPRLRGLAPGREVACYYPVGTHAGISRHGETV